MSKQLKLNDETYYKLKSLADMHHRTLGGQIEWLIDGDAVSDKAKVPEIVDTNDSKGILAMIGSLTAEINNADKDNQDPDYWDIIAVKRAEVQRLWDRWHKVTGK